MVINMSKPKISIVTMGCNKNLVDSERIIFELSNDYTYTDNPADTDILILNTCGFIDSAKEQNINAILEAVHSKQSLGIKKVIVMGCLTERYSEQIKAQIPGIDAVFGANDHQNIINFLRIEKNTTYSNSILNRHLLTPRHYAYLKISEGCSHKCSFCAIPTIRGRHRSVPFEPLIEEAKLISKRNPKELILIAQDTSYYGTDLYGKKRLGELLQSLASLDFEWIRFMYAYPTGFPDDVLDIMASHENICKYLDIPLQHISDRILKSMKRGISKLETIKLIEKIKNKVPNIAIRSTFIVGYPGETQSEFNDLLAFLKDADLDRVGAFPYSKEEDTSAFDLEDNIKIKTKNSRLEKLMMLQSEISLAKNKKKIGSEVKVLIEESDETHYFGRTEHDAPEVDNLVLISKREELKIGEFYKVKISDASEYDLYAN